MPAARDKKDGKAENSHNIIPNYRVNNSSASYKISSSHLGVAPASTGDGGGGGENTNTIRKMAASCSTPFRHQHPSADSARSYAGGDWTINFGARTGVLMGGEEKGLEVETEAG